MHTKFHVDENGRTIRVYVEDDVEQILEENKSLRSIPQKSNWGRHVATIPNVILNRWLDEERARGNHMLRMGGEEWDQLVKRKLADPAWKFLRTDK